MKYFIICICSFVLTNSYALKINNGSYAIVKDSITPKKDSTIDDDDTRSFNFSIEYLSDQTYKGLKNETPQQTITPSFVYEAISGFNCTVAGNYVKDASNPWNSMNIGAGYDFTIYKKLFGGVSYTKYYFDKNSEQLSSTLNHNLECYLKFKPHWIKSKLIFDYNIGKTKDYGISFENSHKFEFSSVLSKEDELDLVPKLALNSGTQNFYIISYNRFFNKNAAKITSFNNSVQEYNKTHKKQIKPVAYNPPTPDKFGMLSYDFSLSLTYNIGSFYIEPAYHYIIAVNQPEEYRMKTLKQLSNINSTDSNSGYFQITLYYILETK